MPQVQHEKSWLLTHPIAVWGSAGLVVLGAGVVVAIMSFGFVGFNKVSPSAQKKDQPAVIPVKTPTAEQIRATKNIVRAEGKISSITASAITLTLTNQVKPVTLKLTDSTLYSAGSKSQTSDKASLRLGQLAVVVYDVSTGAAASVWGGYNE